MMTPENYFLIALALVWILAAVIQDFRKREVANWLNFSLIAIALAYRAFVSLWLWDYTHFVYGLLGFAVFLALANAFYYGRIFAGGDAKLLMGLGAVLPFSPAVYENLEIFVYFILLLMFSGSVYGLVYSIVLSYKNRERFGREFKKQFLQNKKLFVLFTILAIFILLIVLLIGEHLLAWLSLIVFVFPFLYAYAKAIEESCMIKLTNPKNLTVGDWLCREVKVGRKIIKPDWEGLSEKELKILKKAGKKVLVKEGIPFTPAFLIAFIVLIILWNSSGGFWQVF